MRTGKRRWYVYRISPALSLVVYLIARPTTHARPTSTNLHPPPPSQKGSVEDLTTWQARAAKQNPNKPGAGHIYVKMKGKAEYGVDREKDPKGYYKAEAKAAKGT